jgi:hypothetical protein
VRHRGSEPAVQIIRSVSVGVPILIVIVIVIVIVSLDDDFQAEGFIPSGALECLFPRSAPFKRLTESLG